MIHFKNVTKKYSEASGLQDITLDIEKGEFVFIVGPSGAGKSTFIKLIMKEVEADKGSILVMGNEVVTMPNRKLPKHRRNIGMIFQDFRLLPNKTVYENVAFAMEIVHKSQRQIKKQVPLALSLMGISGKSDMFPNELSAGEQQRVAIARAIINKPSMLIADEPTGNLDPDTAWEIMNLLDEINRRGTTVVMVTHAKDIVDKMKKRVVTIDNGQIVSDYVGVYRMEEIAKELAKQLDEDAEMTIGDYISSTEDIEDRELSAEKKTEKFSSLPEESLEGDLNIENTSDIYSEDESYTKDTVNLEKINISTEDVSDNNISKDVEASSKSSNDDNKIDDDFIVSSDVYEPSNEDIDKYLENFEKEVERGGDSLE